MALIRKRKNNKHQSKEEIEPEKCSLYILMDAPKIGIVQYMKENGIEIKDIYYDIVEANYGFMQESENSRIVIVDTGTGLFSKMSNREELVSLLGMCSGNKNGMLFYTDVALRTTIGKSIQNTTINRYVSTLDIVSKLKEINEDYCYGGAEDAVVSGLLQYKGIATECELSEQRLPLVDTTEGVLGDENDTVIRYDVKY